MIPFRYSVLLVTALCGCSTDTSDQTRAKAEEAVGKGQYEVADNLWSTAAQKFPNDYQIFYNRGTTLVSWGNCGGPEAIEHYKNACVQFEKAANLKPDFDSIFYNWGNAAAKIAILNPTDTDLYILACDKYQKATEINPNKDQAFYNWGTVLFSWAKLGNLDARDKCIAACDKFQQSTAINPEKYDAFNNWGLAVIYLAKIDLANKTTLLKQAETIFLKSEAIKRGHSAYNIACVHALLDDEEQCKRWLKVGEETGTLDTRESAMKDEDLASMKDKIWFKAIQWKGE